MEIKIEISDEKFSEFFCENVEDYITEDIKKEIVKNAITDFCTQDAFRRKIMAMFITDGSYSNNYTPKLTNYGERIFEEAIKDEKELLDPVKEILENIFKEKGSEILVNALSKMIINSLFNSVDFKSRTEEVAEYIANIISHQTLNDHMRDYHNHY